MKVEVNVPRRWAYAVLIMLLFGSGIFAVWAYKSDYTAAGTESVADVATLGHSPNEIEVDLSGTPTTGVTCTGKMTLQSAIANDCLGAGTTGGVGGSGAVVGWVTVHPGSTQGSDNIVYPDTTDHSPTKICQDAGYTAYTGACKVSHTFAIEGTLATNTLLSGKWALSCNYGNSGYYMKTDSVIQCIKSSVSGGQTLLSERYYVETPKSNAMNSVPLDMTKIDALCRDRDGCSVRTGTISQSAAGLGLTDIPFSAGIIYLSETTNWYSVKFDGAQGESKDNDNINNNLAIWWDCALTDYTITAGTYGTDNEVGFHLIDLDTQLNYLEKQCFISVDD